MEIPIKRSRRKTVSLEIMEDGQPLVRAPLGMPEREITAFVRQYAGWIEEKSRLQKERKQKNCRIDQREAELREKARQILPALVERYAAQMGVKPTSVKITSAKKRFGSCSGKNGICFSWRLMAYPLPAVEYVVVHELAHIKQKNHGVNFYREVERVLPDYKKRRKLLQETV